MKYSRGQFFPKTAQINDPYNSLQKSTNFVPDAKGRLLIAGDISGQLRYLPVSRK